MAKSSKAKGTAAKTHDASEKESAKKTSPKPRKQEDELEDDDELIDEEELKSPKKTKAVSSKKSKDEDEEDDDVEEEVDEWEKVEEEISELRDAVGSRDSVVRNSEQRTTPDSELLTMNSKVEEEFGDVIFSLINYARFLQVDAENALEVTNKKFTRRFTQMEEEATKSGKNLADMNLPEMDSIWNSIKKRH